MTSNQNLQTFVPVYNFIPQGENELREFLVEQLRVMADASNAREVASYLEEELLTGGQFIPSTNNTQEMRSIFRKTLSTGAIAAGNNTVPHGITFDSNFTLIKLWVAATDYTTTTAAIITDDHVSMDGTNININASMAYDKGYVVVEYLKEGD